MISLARLVEALGVTDDADLPEIERTRDAALAYIESQTHLTFGPAVSTTRYVKGTGSFQLYLPEPTSTITGVTEYSYPGATGAALAVTTDYIVRVEGRETYLLRVGSGAVWTRGYEYAVTSSVGYAEDEGPKDVEDWLIALVRSEWSTSGEEVMKSETVGGYSYTRFDAVTLDAKHQETLKAWRRLVFA